MYRRLTDYGLILGISCLLGACGFQLRGTDIGGTALPEAWQSMALVTGNPNSEFSRDITTEFAAYGVRWTDRNSANFSLVLGPEQFVQRNLSLNSEARVAEFELTMSAQFSVLDADKNAVIQQTTASIAKRMQNDPRNVVGKTGEMNMLQVEMRTELAQQIMRNIRFYAATVQSNSP